MPQTLPACQEKFILACHQVSHSIISKAAQHICKCFVKYCRLIDILVNTKKRLLLQSVQIFLLFQQPMAIEGWGDDSH